MIFLKIKTKIVIYLKLLIYKCIFLNSIKIGKKLNFRKRFNLNVSNGAKLIIGNNVFFNNDCSINCKSLIMIGNNCIFGENIKIYDHNHIFNKVKVPIYKQGYKYKDVRIGNNCWIGSNVVILPGTCIGDNCVIGAGCIISSSIESNMLVTQNRELNIRRIEESE